jgi:DNA-binding transcriptional LysR family regulator
MIEGVTLEQLRTLRAVVDEGSFSAAARSLGRVQAAVSQTIDRLEAQLGLRLFDRSGRAPRLTRHGEAIAAAATAVQGEIGALDDLVKSLKQGNETSLAIVVDAMFPTSSLVAFAKDFAAEHPAVELVLFSETLSAVTANVRQKHATLGIALEDADMAGLERKHVVSVRLVPVAASSHPLARTKRAIGAAELSKAVQIVLSERGREVGARTKDHGVFSAKTWRVVDLATKHALIAAALGWGHMPEHVVRDDLDHGRLVELRLDVLGPDSLTRSLEIVWRRGAVLGPVARWAETHLTELCRDAVDEGREPKKRRQAT